MSTSLADVTGTIYALQAKLRKAKHGLMDYRTFVEQRLDLKDITEALKHLGKGTDVGASVNMGTKATALLRDDHFRTYRENGAFLHGLFSPLSRVI